MALRVLITHERFPPDFGGGGEYIVLRTAQGLLARGVDVRVLTTGAPELTAFGGVPTERLATSRYGFNLRARAIARAARQADLVHTFTYHACLPSLLAARLTGKPVLCGMLALFGPAWRAMRGPVAGRALQALEHVMVTRRYDRTLFLSAPSRQQAIRLGAPADRALVLQPGIDHARLPQPDRSSPIVLFSGKMETRKGIEHVFNAARALPHIPFVATGWATDMAALRRVAPPNLELVESEGDDRFLAYLRRAAIFFFPSYSETFGIVVAEAMAAGAAVVSSIDTINFAGAQVAPGDEPAMIAAIRALWDSPEQLRAAGAANVVLARAFTWEAHTERLLGIYDDVLASRPATPGSATHDLAT